MKLRRAGIVTWIVFLVLLAYGVTTLVSVQRRASAAEADREEKRAAVARLERENAELEYDIAHAEDPEVRAEAARDQLGLVFPGETVFYDISD